jgi:flagellar biosynthesis protein FliR
MIFSFSPWSFFLILGRTASLIAFFPMFQEGQVPRSVRAGLAIWISLAMLPMLPPIAFQPESLPELLAAVGVEVVVGLVFALAIRLVFAAISLGTQWIDAEIGFQASQQISPLTGTPNSPFGILALAITAMLFWSLGFFENLLMFWAKMFQVLPPPISHIPLGLGETLIQLSSHIFVGGLQIAIPVIAIMYLVSLAIGFLARAIQGANIFVESFNIKLLVGLGFLIVISPLLLDLIRNQLGLIPEAWTALLKVFKSS